MKSKISCVLTRNGAVGFGSGVHAEL